jgi:hypothetical protein
MKTLLLTTIALGAWSGLATAQDLGAGEGLHAGGMCPADRRARSPGCDAGRDLSHLAGVGRLGSAAVTRALRDIRG